MSARLLAAAAALILSLPGCASSGAPMGETQLERRQFQTRTFDGVDSTLVLRAAVNTLLDDGFIVSNADARLGLLTATRKTSKRSLMGTVGSVMTYGLIGPWRTSVVEANVKVDDFGGGAQVRVTFSQDELGPGRGNDSRARGIADPAFYQAFFGRLDKSLFLLKEKL
jgi:hypothetical protein